MPLPTNRQAVIPGNTEQASIPTRVQADSFGTQSAAPTGGTLVTQSRPPAPRPALTSGSAAQGRETLVVSDDGKVDGVALARALDSIQKKIADSTAQARAFPMGNGILFQGVAVTGTLSAGVSADRPGRAGLPDGFVYFDKTLSRPLWLSGTNWVAATGTVIAAASTGSLATTKISHGFGTPAVGVIVTNVKNAVIQGSPRIVLAGNAEDNNTVSIWLTYLPLSGETPTADFYVYR